MGVSSFGIINAGGHEDLVVGKMHAWFCEGECRHSGDGRRGWLAGTVVRGAYTKSCEL